MTSSSDGQQVPIVVIDDERMTCQTFRSALSEAGFQTIHTFDNGNDAWPVISEMDKGVILLDLNMPEKSGEELLPDILSLAPNAQVVMVTAFNDMKTAIRCIKKGAYDYILKPLSGDELVNCVRRASQLSELRNENLRITEQNAELRDLNMRMREKLLGKELKQPEAFLNFVTHDERTLSVLRYCEAVAVGREPILITGETGVGKELIARAIHEVSGCEGRFVAVNMAGLDEHLVTDSLFGHVKGAFTGANNIRRGFVEEATEGTLFLDEIGDLNFDSQIKLLRLLQEREYTPIGSDKLHKSQTRIVTATHVDLCELVEMGKFRQDLYYRLITHNVQIPPLRERPDDIKPLVDFFISEAAREFHKSKPTYPPEMIVLLKTYHFPGNVRELRGMIFDAVSSHESHILSTQSFRDRINTGRMRSRSFNFSKTPHFPDVLPSIKEMTDLLVEEALRRSDNNQRIAAGILGITQQALSKRVNKKTNTV